MLSNIRELPCRRSWHHGARPPTAAPPRPAAAGADADGESEVVVGTEHDEEGEDAVLHRLCPTYAQDVNSPLRHVRTRIYFTSESHCHSVMNVLRYCQLGLPPGECVGVGGGRAGRTASYTAATLVLSQCAASRCCIIAAPLSIQLRALLAQLCRPPPPALVLLASSCLTALPSRSPPLTPSLPVARADASGGGGAEGGLLSEAGQEVLRSSRELDYMTHFVMRMFENKK